MPGWGGLVAGSGGSPGRPGRGGGGWGWGGGRGGAPRGGGGAAGAWRPARAPGGAGAARGAAGGSPGQLGGGPAMHEKPRLPAFVADGQEASCLAGGDLLWEGGYRPERRRWQPVQPGDIRCQLLLDMAGDARQVKGTVHGDAG